MMKNRASLQKYHVMAQAECRMTLAKSIALWKNNTGVAGVEQLMDHQYRNQCMNTLFKIL